MRRTEFLKRFHANPAPVLICDTCAYLDVIRLPFRAQNSIKASFVIQGLLSLDEQLRNKELYLVLPEIITIEYSRNLSNVQELLDKHLSELKTQIEIYTMLEEKLWGTKNSSMIRQDDLINALVAIVANLHREATKIKTEKRLYSLVAERICSCMPPAKRGKNSNGDCYIYEFILSLAKDIRKNNVDIPIGFLSSNTDDFGARGAEPPNIQQDFSRHGILYFNHWNHAINQILASVKSTV